MICTLLHARITIALSPLPRAERSRRNTQFSRPDQVVEDPEHLRLIVDIGPPTMQLQQIQRIHGEIPQAVVDPAREVLAAIALRLFVSATSGLPSSR